MFLIYLLLRHLKTQKKQNFFVNSLACLMPFIFCNVCVCVLFSLQRKISCNSKAPTKLFIPMPYLIIWNFSKKIFLMKKRKMSKEFSQHSLII
jgi:hypothetical protein